MTLLLDMNISPKLVALLHSYGVDAVHWSSIGKADASDAQIVSYANQNEYIVVTYDLDFSTILSITHAKKPSVIQVRKNVLKI